MKNLILMSAFQKLTDPRINRKKMYPLQEILLVALTTLLCGGETYDDMCIFGVSKLATFKELMPFENGIPSRHTFGRVFELLDPKNFQQCFSEWVNSLKKTCPEIEDEVLAIDGKTLRGSAKPSCGIKPLHIVEVWATKNRLVLGNYVVDEKSNEITAIPKILRLLSLEGTIVTIDAMGCQIAIAKQIVDQKGNFIIALKGNQGSLHCDVRRMLEEERHHNLRNISIDFHTTIDKTHGRTVIRKHGFCSQLDWLKKRHPKWGMINSVGFVSSTRIIRGRQTEETRYYVSSLAENVQKFAHAVRAHWGVENSLHYVLDVTFGEDSSKIRNKNAAENMAIVRRVGVNLLELSKDHSPKNISKKGMRLKAGWDDEYLKSVLTQCF
jgi:predicted transposase YbfD/YdcC